MKQLSKTQQDIIDKMRNGWELGSDAAFTGYSRIQQGGLGRGGTVQPVNYGTIRALLKRELIKPSERKFPTLKYGLVEGGQEA